MKNSSKVSVSVKTFADLFNVGNLKVSIPEYQRPYVWTKTKVDMLIKDITEFIKTGSVKLGYYYFGTILLHRDSQNQVLSIIDGQQRITTLLILEYALNHTLPAEKQLYFDSPESKKNIKQALDRFKSNYEFITLLKNLNESIFSKIQITQIVTESQDNAFTFFETQNNRGVRLRSVDFLKAYHLRAIGQYHILLQENCARHWEKLDSNRQPVFDYSNKLDYLFNGILWRARNWKGQKVRLENNRLLESEFQEMALNVQSPEEIPLFPNVRNRRGHSLKATSDLALTFVNESPAHNVDVHALPFSLRQPIYKGLNFFLYTQKYSSILDRLFFREAASQEIQLMQAFHKIVYAPVSKYLQQLFQLSITVYYDKFEDDNLFKFSLWLDYAIGSMRIEKKNLMKQTAMNFLKNYELNFLDVIYGAYRPEEVFDFLQRNEEAAKIYLNENVAAEDGVRWQYKKNTLTFYNKSERSLRNKRKWIDEKLSEIQINKHSRYN